MEDEEQERSIALETGIALFRRYSEKEAAEILGVSPATLQRIRFRGQIAYLHISERTIQYFGKHLIACILQSEQTPQPQTRAHKPDKKAILASARRSFHKK